MAVRYDAQHLNPAQQKQLLIDAKAVCFRWWADILDCSRSFHRQPIDISFEDMLEKHTDRAFFSVLYRDSYVDDPNDVHIEVAFSTMTQPDYFMWVLVECEVAKPILDNYRVYQK